MTELVFVQETNIKSVMNINLISVWIVYILVCSLLVHFINLHNNHFKVWLTESQQVVKRVGLEHSQNKYPQDLYLNPIKPYMYVSYKTTQFYLEN